MQSDNENSQIERNTLGYAQLFYVLCNNGELIKFELKNSWIGKMFHICHADLIPKRIHITRSTTF